MKTSKLYAPTRRNCPSSAKFSSCSLLTRAGFIYQHAAGIYTYLPLMNKVLMKIEHIAREEMIRQGAQELRMPILQRKDVWQQSGRWQDYIDSETMFHLRDRNANEFALGPTHEEVISEVARDVLRSHRQMPVNLFQIGPKFRDEFRPHSGLIRGREFIMKDAYSFDKDEEGLEESYKQMILAYKKILGRCRLDFAIVEADSGPIGGNNSHEFMALTSCGEDKILTCNACSYSANEEKARSRTPDAIDLGAPGCPSELTMLDARVIATLQLNLGIAIGLRVKPVVYRGGCDKFVIALIGGDAQINVIKLKKAVGTAVLLPATDEEVCELTNSLGGLQGFNRPIKVIADESVQKMTGTLCEPHKVSSFAFSFNLKRDFQAPEFADIRYAKAGDPCASCSNGFLIIKKGIELGHVFKLGTKYSEPMGLTFLDEKGRQRPVIMGCYGLGVSRIVAAVVEQNYDENGIIWPASIAPFTVVVIPATSSHKARAEQVYDEFIGAGIDTIFDDRDVNFGVKVKDADLIGYPYKAIIGNHANDGGIEVKDRRHGEGQLLHIKEFPVYINLLNR